MQKWFVAGIALCLIMVVLAGCGSSNNTTNSTAALPSNEGKVTISQGAWGNVWFWEGDFMPPSPTGKISSVVREIHIHRVTKLTDMGVTNSFQPFFSNIPTELIATATSDETGFYQINLPPGIYSVFIKEGTKFYANGYDLQGRIKVVEVLPGTVTKLQLDITYSATF